MAELPQHIEKISRNNRRATAPYNFVPLPDYVIPAVESADDLPDHNVSLDGHYDGYIDVDLTTLSPLFIRGPITQEQLNRQENKQYVDGTPLPIKDNPEFRRLVENIPDFYFTDRDTKVPVIPGSSLRGMLRTMVGIVTFGKFTQVSNTDRIFYRAVAAPKGHPLKKPYEAVMGNFDANIRAGQNVRVGYLENRNGNWYIHPAKLFFGKPYEELNSGIPFKIIKARHLKHKVNGLISLNDRENYRIQYHDVKLVHKTTQEGKSYWTARSPDRGETRDGVLVCSGNMLETSTNANDPSPRSHFLFVPNKDDDKKIKPIKINPQAVQDYQASLTPFQKEQLSEHNGCLVESRPIFYIYDQEIKDEIFYFGHSPNFRIPATYVVDELADSSHTVTPRDRIPKDLRSHAYIDFAEAIFGYVRTSDELDELKSLNIDIGKQGDKRRAYAGRVFVTDAIVQPPVIGEFYVEPKILASPKPTCFQHYLVQESDKLSDLKHYGSDTVVVRGHKLYWNQGKVTKDHLKDSEVSSTSTQHTCMQPIGAGNHFKFRIYFENLSEVELGALLWAVRLPIPEQNFDYCHRLGMGKPLGMGAVKLHPKLHIIHRKTRYQTLFAVDEDNHPIQPIRWNTGDQPCSERDIQDCINSFETFILKQLNQEQRTFTEINRIKILLRMLEWWPDDSHNRNSKSYMLLLDDFKKRPVLPSPLDRVSKRPPIAYLPRIGSVAEGKAYYRGEHLWFDYKPRGKKALKCMIPNELFSGNYPDTDQEIQGIIIAYQPENNDFIAICEPLIHHNNDR